MQILALSFIVAVVSSQTVQDKSTKISDVLQSWDLRLPTTAETKEITVKPTESSYSVDSEGRRCQCVPYYQCDSENESVKNPVSAFDDREGDPCQHYSEVCCINPKLTKPQPDSSKIKGCGYRNLDGFGRIFHGTRRDTKFGEFPWVVALLDSKNSSYAGAGVIISPQVVMTVAHAADKFTPETLKIRAGEWDSQTLNEIYDHQERQVKEIYVHEEYIFSKKNLWNDIALLLLEEPLQLTEHINAICLPEQDEPFDNYQNCISNGWGKEIFGKEGRYTVILKKLELNMIPHGTCKVSLKRTRLGARFNLHNSFVCATEIDNDYCIMGDGGASLACPIGDNRYKLSGLVAWGLGCNQSVPAVHTNVPKFRQWVDQRMQYWNLTIPKI